MTIFNNFISNSHQEWDLLGENIQIIIPEIFLGTSLVLLLAYGVIYSKVGGIVSQLKKITNLTILSLFWTLYLIVDLNNIYLTNSNIQNNIDQLINNNINIINNNNVLTYSVLSIDNVILMVKMIIIISAICILILSLGVYKNKREKIVDYEYTQLILLSTLGMLLLISSRDLVVMYLSIETLSLSLYIMAAIRKTGQLSTEAGLKYFILGALSSGLLLFGCALIYISTGLTDFHSLTYLILYNNSNLVGIEIGTIFILFAILFKLAAAPFHMWAPDVYEGSPSIVTAYFAIVPKIAILLLLITLIYGPFLGIFNIVVKPLIIISGLLSVIIGSLGALNQTKIKRLLAYSAIGHIGFIILGLAPATINSLQASLVYMILYIIMSLNTFSFILIYFNKYRSSFSISDKSCYISELSGLSRKEPVLAATFALSLLSIAGIPPLAGFFSKYLILLSLIENSMYIISLITILFSVIACFYYIRIIQWMYFNNSKSYAIKDLADIAYNKVGLLTDTHKNNNLNNRLDLGTVIILGITFYIILSLLLYPNPLLILTFDSIINTFI